MHLGKAGLEKLMLMYGFGISINMENNFKWTVIIRLVTSRHARDSASMIAAINQHPCPISTHPGAQTFPKIRPPSRQKVQQALAEWEQAQALQGGAPAVNNSALQPLKWRVQAVPTAQSAARRELESEGRGSGPFAVLRTTSGDLTRLIAAETSNKCSGDDTRVLFSVSR